MHDYSGLATWFAWTTVDFQMQCSTGDDIRATSCWLAREMVQGFSESAISTRQLGIRLQEKYRGTRPVMLVYHSLRMTTFQHCQWRELAARRQNKP